MAEPLSLTQRLQQRCSDWGAYWRAQDAHGVDLTHDQAVELLRDALGVEVAIAPAAPPEAPAAAVQALTDDREAFEKYMVQMGYHDFELNEFGDCNCWVQWPRNVWNASRAALASTPAQAESEDAALLEAPPLPDVSPIAGQAGRNSVLWGLGYTVGHMKERDAMWIERVRDAIRSARKSGESA
jgi:hypothetical protein